MRAKVQIAPGREYTYEAPAHVQVGDEVHLPPSAHGRGLTGIVKSLGDTGYDSPAKQILGKVQR